MKASTRRLLLASILILALILRATGLEWSLPDQHHYKTYCSDEHRAVCMALMMEPAEGELAPIWRGNPYFKWGSLHIYTLAAAYTLADSIGFIEAGGALGSWSVESYARATLLARWISVLYGVGAVLLVYLLGKRWYGIRAGLAAALIYAICPIDSYNAHFALINTVSSFWILLALGSIGRALEVGRLRDHARAGLLIGIAIGAKLSALPLIPVALVIAGWSAWLQRSEQRLARQLPAAFACVLIPAFIGFALATPYAFVHTQDFLRDTYIELVLHPKQGHGLFFLETGNGFIYLLFTNLPVAVGWPLWGAGLAAFLWVGARFLRNVRASVWRAPTPAFIGDTLLIVWTIGMVIALSRSQVRFMRYLMAFTPCLALFCACAFEDLRSGAAPRWRIRAAHALALLLLLPTAFYTFSQSLALTSTDPRDTAAVWFDANVPKRAKIALLAWPTHHVPPVHPWAQSTHKGPSLKAQKKGVGPKGLRWTLLNKKPDKLLAEKPDWIVMNPIDLWDGLRLGDAEITRLAELIEEHYVDAAGPWTAETSLLGISCDWEDKPRGWAPTTATIRILKRR